MHAYIIFMLPNRIPPTPKAKRRLAPASLTAPLVRASSADADAHAAKARQVELGGTARRFRPSARPARGKSSARDRRRAGSKRAAPRRHPVLRRLARARNVGAHARAPGGAAARGHLR